MINVSDKTFPDVSLLRDGDGMSVGAGFLLRRLNSRIGLNHAGLRAIGIQTCS
jgi:hypothetical protein